jgi:hypothetical protein
VSILKWLSRCFIDVIKCLKGFSARLATVLISLKAEKSYIFSEPILLLTGELSRFFSPWFYWLFPISKRFIMTYKNPLFPGLRVEASTFISSDELLSSSAYLLIASMFNWYFSRLNFLVSFRAFLRVTYCYFPYYSGTVLLSAVLSAILSLVLFKSKPFLDMFCIFYEWFSMIVLMSVLIFTSRLLFVLLYILSFYGYFTDTPTAEAASTAAATFYTWFELYIIPTPEFKLSAITEAPPSWERWLRAADYNPIDYGLNIVREGVNYKGGVG